MLLSVLETIASTPWSIGLRESLYAWSLLESTHVLALTLFVGTAFVNDLRLIGWSLRRVPVSEVTGRLLPLTRIGFAVMALTGLLLVYADPLRYYDNVFFRLKVLLLIAAGANVFWFHRGIHRRVAEWELDPDLPRQARVAGAVSLVVWSLIVVSGRLIAYSWFDCDIQPQPAFINWFAGCSIEP